MTMPTPDDSYTYRDGRKIRLAKDPASFVVRAEPEVAATLGVEESVRTSAASTRVRVQASQLEAKMAASRRLAPTHHAYTREDSGAEFLITDRVLVELKPDAPP